MSKFIYPLLLLLFVSCSREECDCSIYTEKLKEVAMNMTTPIDLPEMKDEPESAESNENQLTAIIFENNKYGFDDDETQYTFEEYKEALREKMEYSPFKIKKLKIDGHRLAHYESVFKILAFCQANDLNPVLAYDK